MGLVLEWWLTETLVFLVTITLIVYVSFRMKYRYWKKKGVPYLEPSFPLGNTWNTTSMRMCAGEAIKEVYKTSAGLDVVGVFSFNNPILIVLDVELVKTIIVKDFNYFTDRGIYIDEERDYLSMNLFFLTGTKWRSLRQKLTPTFTSGKMRAMFDIVRDCANTLRDVTPAGTTVEVRELIARYSTDVIASCAFGLEVDSQHNPDAEFRQCGRRFFEPSMRAFITQALGFSNPSLRKLLPVAFTPTDVAEYFTRVVSETVKYREETGVTRKDFMQLLVQLKKNGFVDDSFSVDMQNKVKGDTKTLTIKEVAAQAWVFFLAGFETSSSTTSFCLYELSKNQEIQKRLQDEIDDVLQKNGGAWTYEVIMSQMPYLEKVVCETLRVYPPVPILNRETVKDYRLPGYNCVIEKGTKIIIPVMGLQHDQKYFQNADSFDPEHFSEEQKASRHPFSYLPFGEGPRICIGMRFGQMQVKLALVHLLSQFVFLPPGGPQKRLRFAPHNAVLTPVGGLPLRIERRQATAF